MELRLERHRRPLHPALGWGLVGGCAALLAAAAWFPFGALPKLCAFLLLTDLPCLTCGMTRAWVALVHGDLLEAVAWNPGGVALCVATVLGAAYLAGRQLGAPALVVQTRRWERTAARVALVLGVAANWGYVVWAGRV